MRSFVRSPLLFYFILFYFAKHLNTSRQGAVDSSIRKNRELVKLEDSYFKSKLSKQLGPAWNWRNFFLSALHRGLPKLELLPRFVLLSRYPEPLKVTLYPVISIGPNSFFLAPGFFSTSNFVLCSNLVFNESQRVDTKSSLKKLCFDMTN